MRVVICEDSTLLREGISRLLQFSHHEVLAALPDAEKLAETVEQEQPDLVILDVRLPPTWSDEGIRAALDLRQRFPALPILVLSQYVEERYAAELIQAQSYALGYLLKDRVTNVTEFLSALQQVADGGTVFDPEVIAQLINRNQGNEKMRRLTDRERSVLAALSEGKSNQAIAALLHLSEGSIEKHITSIFQKLELDNDNTGNRRVLAVLAHLKSSQAESPSPRSQL
jgi:DNA-binding NarL/FixJ family response regulator